jgi:hypothetical protein
MTAYRDPSFALRARILALDRERRVLDLELARAREDLRLVEELSTEPPDPVFAWMIGCAIAFVLVALGACALVARCQV